MNAHRLINQDSGNTEYYTPQEIIQAARRTMTGIDCDPASSEKANERVKALCFFSATINGLAQNWWGRVWMNHPFSREGNPKWIAKLIGEFDSDAIEQACCITFAATSEQWFAPLLKFPQCYLRPRTNYRLPDGTLKRGVTKGSVVTYLGPRVREFCEAFQNLGSCMIPAGGRL